MIDVVAVGQALGFLAGDLLLDLRGEVNIEARGQVGCAFNLANRRVRLRGLREARMPCATTLVSCLATADWNPGHHFRNAASLL